MVIMDMESMEDMVVKSLLTDIQLKYMHIMSKKQIYAYNVLYD